MRRENLVIKISGSIGEGTALPVHVAWRVTASPEDTAEDIGKAVTQACRELNIALKEALK